jgi:hypothetical protein
MTDPQTVHTNSDRLSLPAGATITGWSFTPILEQNFVSVSYSFTITWNGTIYTTEKTPRHRKNRIDWAKEGF